MTWAEIAQLFQGATGNATAAVSEQYIHLNNALKRLSARLDLQQLEEDVSVLTTTAGVDFVTLPSDVFHVLSCHNTTVGCPVSPEPSGMRGRERYYEPDTGMPVEGQPIYYAITAGRIYLRDTPDDVYELNLRYKVQPATITSSDLASSPTIPAQWHLAIATAAAESYFIMHPDSDNAYAQEGPPRSAVMAQQTEQVMASSPMPKDRERADQRGRQYMAFYLRR